MFSSTIKKVHEHLEGGDMLIKTKVAYLLWASLDEEWFIILPKENDARMPVGCKEHGRYVVKLLEEEGDISKEEVMSLNQQINDSNLPEVWRSQLEVVAFLARITSEFEEQVIRVLQMRQAERGETLH